jgi:hypothetical protein
MPSACSSSTLVRSILMSGMQRTSRAVQPLFLCSTRLHCSDHTASFGAAIRTDETASTTADPGRLQTTAQTHERRREATAEIKDPKLCFQLTGCTQLSIDDWCRVTRVPFLSVLQDSRQQILWALVIHHLRRYLETVDVLLVTGLCSPSAPATSGMRVCLRKAQRSGSRASRVAIGPSFSVHTHRMQVRCWWGQEGDPVVPHCDSWDIRACGHSGTPLAAPCAQAG